MYKECNNLLIAASGTGGHIFPALSIAKELDEEWDITWLGIKNRCESTLVPEKYSLFTLNIISPQKKKLSLIVQYIKIILSTFEILKIIFTKKISLIFTTGGYISAPSILAAKISNIPIILHESNLEPGLVTRYFGRFCDNVLLGFNETNKYLKSSKTIFTGTPLRKQFYEVNKSPHWMPVGDGPIILIMGGSQGAKGLNEMVRSSLDFLLSKNIRLIHIIGENEFLDIQNPNYIQIEFTDQIAELMQNCDLVISRSGSGAINELVQTQKPSILVPYPNSKNNHQESNALILSSIGGSILINQTRSSNQYFKKTLERIFDRKNKNNNYEILKLMQNNMSKIKVTDPRSKIIHIIQGFKKD